MVGKDIAFLREENVQDKTRYISDISERAGAGAGRKQTIGTGGGIGTRGIANPTHPFIPYFFLSCLLFKICRVPLLLYVIGGACYYSWNISKFWSKRAIFYLQKKK